MIHLGVGDGLRWGVDEAEFADGEVIFVVADGWPEGAALDGAGGVEVAGAGCGVEDRAGLVVGKVFEVVFVVRLGEELPCGGVAGEVGGETLAGGSGSGADAGGYGWFGGSQGGVEGLGVEG